MRVAVLAGSGIVARRGHAVAVLAPDAPDRGVDALLGALDDAAAAADHRVALRRVVGVLGALDPADVPAFALAVAAGSGVAVLLAGPTEVRWHAPDGEHVLSGTVATTWVDCILRDVQTVFVTNAGGDAPSAVPPGVDLEDGVVPGAGALVALVDVPSSAGEQPREVEAAPTLARPPVDHVAGHDAPGPAHDPASAAQDDAGAPDRAAPAPDDEPGVEIVDGILCPNGHFIHPHAVRCPACGTSTIDLSVQRARRARPPLGMLVADDGSSYVLERDVVLGRDPAVDARVASGDARAWRLDDVERSLSRVHADVRLVGWDVLVVDRGSVNGTYVRAPEDRDWRRLQPDEPVAVPVGTAIAVGKRVMTLGPPPQVGA